MQHDLDLFSPRWGHTDRYSVSMNADTLEITQGARIARATWQPNGAPVWSGEPLEGTMTNDHIHPPTDIQDFFEYVWREWRAGHIDDARAAAVLDELEDWLNAITEAKPQSDFWKTYF